jgi:hypothetical protein
LDFVPLSGDRHGGQEFWDPTKKKGKNISKQKNRGKKNLLYEEQDVENTMSPPGKEAV